MPDFHQSVPSPAPGLKPPPFQFSEATRESVRAPVPEDFSVPARFIAFSGVILGILMVAAGKLFYFYVPRIPYPFPVAVALFAVGWAVAALLEYIAFRGLVWDDLAGFRTKERIVGPAPEAAALPPVINKLDWIVQTPSGQYYLGEFDLPQSLILEWCTAAVEGRSLAIGNWAPRFALPNGQGGEARYQQFLDQLAKGENRVVQNKGGSAGWKPTAFGWNVIVATLNSGSRGLATPALPRAEDEKPAALPAHTQR